MITTQISVVLIKQIKFPLNWHIIEKVIANREPSSSQESYFTEHTINLFWAQNYLIILSTNRKKNRESMCITEESAEKINGDGTQKL